jgi:two-component system chemotaxis sensor kinase CheA
MIIDPNGIAQTCAGMSPGRHVADAPSEADVEPDHRESMLLFRAGSPQPKAVPLSLVARLEEIDPRSIELSNQRPILQYRGQLMPLVPVNDDVRIKSDNGTQPLLVFSAAGRSMALVVDEIVDIVEGRLEIALHSPVPGVIGSAIIKGQATEVIDLGHYMPEAFADWFNAPRPSGGMPRVLLVDDMAFFRDMLVPVLRAAGYAVTTASSVDEALVLLQAPGRFEVVVTDIEMPGKDGFDLVAAIRDDPRTAQLPVIGLSSLVSADAIERGRQVGLHDYVAKFDRQGLIAALKEQTADLAHSAERAA